MLSSFSTQFPISVKDVFSQIILCLKIELHTHQRYLLFSCDVARHVRLQKNPQLNTSYFIHGICIYLLRHYLDDADTASKNANKFEHKIRHRNSIYILWTVL